MSGTAGNGATKASAPEERIVHGRLPILRKRKEADPRVLARRKSEKLVRGDKKLENVAGQEQKCVV